MKTGIALLVPLLALASCSIRINDEDGGSRRYSKEIQLDDPAFVQANYAYFIHPTRGQAFIDAPTADESRLVGEHFAYLQNLTEKEVVLLAGPTTNAPYTGIVLFRAENDVAAEQIMRSDPAVRGGVFQARVSPFHLSLLAGRD